MKYYVITESGVHTYNSMLAVKKEVSLEGKDFVELGNDRVLYMTDHSFEVVKDIRLLETVASKKVFSKDALDTQGWISIITLVFMLLLYTKGGGH